MAANGSFLEPTSRQPVHSKGSTVPSSSSPTCRETTLRSSIPLASRWSSRRPRVAAGAGSWWHAETQGSPVARLRSPLEFRPRACRELDLRRTERRQQAAEQHPKDEFVGHDGNANWSVGLAASAADGFGKGCRRPRLDVTERFDARRLVEGAEPALKIARRRSSPLAIGAVPQPFVEPQGCARG